MTVPAFDAPPEHEHEHDLHLVMVDYDQAGRTIREYECTSCGTAWFE